MPDPNMVSPLDTILDGLTGRNPSHEDGKLFPVRPQVHKLSEAQRRARRVVNADRARRRQKRGKSAHARQPGKRN